MDRGRGFDKGAVDFVKGSFGRSDSHPLRGEAGRHSAAHIQKNLTDKHSVVSPRWIQSAIRLTISCQYCYAE